MSQGIGGLFGGNNWIWIILILVFLLPGFGSGCGTGGLFGGSSWLLIILLVIIVLPSLGCGHGIGGFGNLGNLFGCGC